MKETHYKLKHRVTALFAAAVMLCSMLPGAAFAEEPTPQPTEETAQMEQQTEPSETDNGQTDESSPDPGEDVTEATPETAEEQPAEEEISAAVVGAELYTDLPDAPIGSYIGSEGLPVATGETKIGISEWPESQLEEGGSYLTAVALDNDGLTMAAPLLDGADYAIVPIMAQVEYPADGSSTDMILPDGVTLLDFYGEPATDADALLHNSYHETSAAVIGVYVQAAADFNAQLVYTGPDGSTQTKTLYVTIDREHTVASPFADAGIAAYGERPIPDVTSGKITKVAKVNGTWLIWFNGEPAYCCTPGADGQPKNCPTYTYVNTSMVGADQYVPGDHYGNQYRIWGGLTQLSLGMQELPPVALSAEAPSLLDSCRTIYTDAQMQIIENYQTDGPRGPPAFYWRKNMKHILSCSFGKDSIATALLALQHGEPLDELVYCEVMFSEEISGELPEHNRFIHETAIPYFEQRGIPTRVLRSEKTYLSCFYHVVTRGKTKGMLSGFPLSGRCTIQRDCKLPPIKAYQKALPPDTVQYIGIAADEPKRLARLKPGQISLLDKYHVAEPEARSMCAAEELLSPLYDFTKRGGCWFCPNASISELRHLYRYHPELWQLLLELQDVPNKPTERFSWRRTFREIDERFRQEGEQLSFYEER